MEYQKSPCTDEYFYKNKKSPDGLMPYCKTCNKQKSDEWRYANPEKFKIIAIRRNHQPKATEIRTRFSEFQRRSGYTTEWQHKNKERLKSYNFKYAHKKHTITKKEWIACKDYFKNENGEWSCAYCGLPISKHFQIRKGKTFKIDFHKEHVDCNGAKDLSNCVPSCQSCNSSKRQNIFAEWYRQQSFYSEEKYSKIMKWLNEDYKLHIKSQ